MGPVLLAIAWKKYSYIVSNPGWVTQKYLWKFNPLGYDNLYARMRVSELVFGWWLSPFLHRQAVRGGGGGGGGASQYKDTVLPV